jgi:hypothetical protein
VQVRSMMQFRAGPSIFNQKKSTKQKRGKLIMEPQQSQTNVQTQNVQMQKQPVTEQPIYVLAQNKKRALIPKVVSLLGLGIIFYLGILLNVSLLDLKAGEETLIKVIALIVLLSVLILGIYISFHRANQNYKFYRGRIVFLKQQINYLNIINTKSQVDFIDKMFKTYTINLGNKFFLRNIPNTVQIENYLQQLIAYSKKVNPGS